MSKTMTKDAIDNTSGRCMAREPRVDDVVAGNEFRDSLVPKADAERGGSPLWHGWAIMDAFLAGVAHADAKAAK